MTDRSLQPRPIVAINFPFADTSWLGGANSISHLLSAYHALPDRQLDLVVVAPTTIPGVIEKTLPPLPIWHTAMLDSGSPAALARRIVRRLTGRDWLMERWLRRRGVRVFSHADPLGARARVPVIGYITDLSFHHLTDLYPPEALAIHERYIRRTVAGVDTLLLMSHAVEADFARFYGGSGAVREVAHVVPIVPPRDRTIEIDAIRRYDLPERFFYLPNKFWVHKNHAVVIEALGILRTAGTPVCVVCSGVTGDERQPGHFETVMARVAALGVADDFRVLGMIPGADVNALLRASVAVLSPSIHEGWGLTIAEAREMGKTVIVSDIPVFREQAPSRAQFFDPHDARALATILRDADALFDADVDDAAQERAAATHRARQATYAKRYEAIVLETLARASWRPA